MKKVEIIDNLCIGCGVCTSNAAFILNDQGISVVVPENINEESYSMAELCPTAAISVIDEEAATEE